MTVKSVGNVQIDTQFLNVGEHWFVSVGCLCWIGQRYILSLVKVGLRDNPEAQQLLFFYYLFFIAYVSQWCNGMNWRLFRVLYKMHRIVIGGVF